MMRTMVILILAWAGAATAAEAPKPPSPRVQQMFAKSDLNKDGVLTLDEWKASGHREGGFRIIDADHDGKITPAEMQAAAARFGMGG